jgi:hypothetical protein
MKSPIVMLTAALVVCLTGSAWAQHAVSQDLRSPDTVTPAVPDPARGQDLRSPDTVTPPEPRQRRLRPRSPCPRTAASTCS